MWPPRSSVTSLSFPRQVGSTSAQRARPQTRNLTVLYAMVASLDQPAEWVVVTGGMGSSVL